MRAFQLVFVALDVGAALSVGIWGHRSAPVMPQDLGIGPAFSGDLILPRAEIERALAQGRRLMLESHKIGLRLKFPGDLSVLLAFLATSAVTLILGWWGRAPRAGDLENVAPDSGVPVKAARWIGFLAAVAAALTGFGHFASESAQAHFASGDRMRDQLDQTRKDVIAAKTADEAQAALDRLATPLGR